MIAVPRNSRTTAGLIRQLRTLALRGLGRMYQPDAQSFVFRVRRWGPGVVAEGLSHRYTAIALIGLAGEREGPQVLPRTCLHDICGRLVSQAREAANLGDVALTIWAAHALGYPDRTAAWDRLAALCPLDRGYPVVELSWTLAALCLDQATPFPGLRERLAGRLIASFERRSGMFPHIVGKRSGALRDHVSCFADLVYPVHALAHYSKLAGDRRALQVASECAQRICALQGPAGQWWWHYDRRTGAVVERYPVYAVHQDAMAPMALLALQDAGGGTFEAELARGLAWLAHAPELNGGSLIDEGAGLIWRKVARREPGKLSRYAQAMASRVHPDVRVPGLDVILPPGRVDHEDRPYHLGWVLHAWPRARLAQWEAQEESR